jgi:hypothetical protein
MAVLVGDTAVSETKGGRQMTMSLLNNAMNRQ